MRYKTLQNALFKLSGGQAMPNYNGKISGVALNNNQSVTAPVNGYFLVHAVVSDTNAINDVSVTLSNSDRITTTQGCREGNWVDFLLPIQKGMTYVFRFLNIQTARYDIFPLVGGINRLLSLAQTRIRGGVLCLLTSSILSARYLSCRVRKRSQQTKTGLFLQTHKRAVLTPHPVMGISASITKILASSSSICIQRLQKQSVAELRRSITLAGIPQAEQFLLKKAMLSNGNRTLRLLKCGSFRLLDRNSLNETEVCHA